MKKGFNLVVVFVVAVILLVASVYAYYMPYEQWVLLGNLVKYSFFTIVAVLVSRVFSKVFFSCPETSEQETDKPKVQEEVLFEQESVKELSGHSFRVKSKDGRIFLFAKGRDNVAAYQEIDNKGNKIGSPVMANVDSWRFGEDPNRALANHLKNKIRG